MKKGKKNTKAFIVFMSISAVFILAGEIYTKYATTNINKKYGVGSNEE
jgi:hypothetical protein